MFFLPIPILARGISEDPHGLHLSLLDPAFRGVGESTSLKKMGADIVAAAAAAAVVVVDVVFFCHQCG